MRRRRCYGWRQGATMSLDLQKDYCVRMRLGLKAKSLPSDLLILPVLLEDKFTLYQLHAKMRKEARRSADLEEGSRMETKSGSGGKNGRCSLVFCIRLMARQPSPEIDDELFNEVYGKEYTGPMRSASNNAEEKTNANKRTLANDQSDEEIEARDPNAVPTDFTSREAKVWEAKAKAIERNWKKRKEEEMICKLCGESGHFTQRLVVACILKNHKRDGTAAEHPAFTEPTQTFAGVHPPRVLRQRAFCRTCAITSFRRPYAIASFHRPCAISSSADHTPSHPSTDLMPSLLPRCERAFRLPHRILPFPCVWTQTLLIIKIMGCPSTLGANRKSAEIFERVPARDKNVRALFSDKVISHIEKDVGCKIRMDEKFLFVSGKDRLILSKGVDAVHKIIQDNKDKSNSPNRSDVRLERARSRSPVRNHVGGSHLKRSESQKSRSSTIHLHSKGYEDNVRDDLQRLSRGSSQAYANDGVKSHPAHSKSPTRPTTYGDNSFSSYDGQNRNIGLHKRSGWDVGKSGMDSLFEHKPDISNRPQTLEELEMEFKREMDDLGSVRDQEENEEILKHREVFCSAFLTFWPLNYCNNLYQKKSLKEEEEEEERRGRKRRRKKRRRRRGGGGGGGEEEVQKKKKKKVQKKKKKKKVQKKKKKKKVQKKKKKKVQKKKKLTTVGIGIAPEWGAEWGAGAAAGSREGSGKWSGAGLKT
ncbi:hypothetical protein KSP39_PZI014302 [Platanthera zijinensis]|uniref:Uncharacterized protein n=1 Tax=Platanthera zijinensis TaxID=2320716 RepID=A0AAP0G2I4_9ASPA